MAGTLAAEGRNGIGVIGVAWGARVMCVKGLDDAGSGYASLLASAIVYAVDNGADVINASWGGPGPSQVLKDAVDYAASLGVVFVASAGNESADARDFVPAGLSNVITVAASDASDLRAYFSNRGPRIDVAAPGVDILSLRAQGTSLGSLVDPLLTRLQGTSMAAPHVAGLAALVLARYPAYSTEQVRQAIRVAAVDLGAAGADGDFGYGRIDAAQALAVNSALEARIHEPADGARISGPVSFTGLAQGAGFARYELAYGAGETPASWTTFAEGVEPVAGGPLATWDTGVMSDGLATVRLTVFDTGGRSYVDQRQILVDWVSFTNPAPPASPGAAAVFKPGQLLALDGKAMGPSFTRFRMEWARGINPDSGWSDVGIRLVSGGLAPVEAGRLGSWDTTPVTQADYYTLRVVVDNATSSNEARTLVYLEPDLLTTAWPRLLEPGAWDGVGAHPLLGPAGERMLTLATVADGAGQIRRLAADGSSMQTIDTAYGGLGQFAVANLDGKRGDETIVGQVFSLWAFSGDGTSVTFSSPSADLQFHRSLVTVTDLDGDASPEVLAVGTNPATGEASLVAWRADGTPLGGSFPVAFPNRNASLDEGRPRFVVADLEGDGTKEIVLAEGPTSSSFSLRLLGPDGSPRPWPDREFVVDFDRLMVADLDGDGSREVIVVERHPDSSFLVSVLGTDGNTKSGWPVGYRRGPPALALADLDNDGQNEVIVSAGWSIDVRRANGQPFSSAWPRGGPDGTGAPSNFGPAVAGDMDGDGLPEIVVLTERDQTAPWPLFPSDSPLRESAAALTPTLPNGSRLRSADAKLTSDSVSRGYFEYKLLVFQPDGTLARSWRLLGTGDRQIVGWPVPTIADVDGDGRTDVALDALVIKSTSAAFAFVTGSVVTVLTTGSPHGLRPDPWPSIYHDTRNSSFLARDGRPPTVTLTFPSDGAFVHGAIRVRAAATDDISVEGVQFHLDGVPLGPEDRSVPFEVDWGPVCTDNGRHVLAAVARDTAGNRTTSAAVGVTVDIPCPPPFVVVARINAGGPAFVDSQGRSWSADANFNTGNSADASAAYPGPDAPLYGTERWDPPSEPELSYSFPAGPRALTRSGSLRRDLQRGRLRGRARVRRRDPGEDGPLGLRHLRPGRFPGRRSSGPSPSTWRAVR